MELHINEEEVLRILLDYANAMTAEEVTFDRAEVSRYPTYKVILRKAEPYEPQ